MATYDLALIGFGGVNRALAELIAHRGPQGADETGCTLRVVGISDLRAGSLMNPDGVDLDRILAIHPDALAFADFAGGSAEPRNEFLIKSSTADIIVEATFTNPTDGEPALSHVKWALESGKHVCTTNKGPVALAGEDLKTLAVRNGVAFEFEGSVMSGTPIIRLGRRMFPGLKVTGFEGIMNGTSNYVLGELERGLTLEAAIADAQALGYAEADPTADLEGFDVQLKVMILANELLGARLRIDDVERTGISGISAVDIATAQAEGKRWKLVGSARRHEDGSVKARVAPVALPVSHPLAGIAGATNAMAFETDLLGAVTVSGPGAGRTETAYALLSDIIAIHERVDGSAHATPAIDGLLSREPAHV